MRPSPLAILACVAALAVLIAAPARAEPGLTVTVMEDGGIRAAGEVPGAFPLDELRRRVAGIDLSAARRSARAGEAEPWEALLDALSVILPRLAAGEARIVPGRLAVEGRLHPGFSAEATRGAVRLALGPGWEATLDLAEPPPRAAMTLAWSPRGAVASGILPAGLDRDEALDLLGDPAPRGLADGGGGDADGWRRVLARLARLRPAYHHATARVAPGTVAVEGRLRPGHAAGRLERWMAEELGEGWEVAVSGAETPATDGDTRHDPVTGGPQRLVGGRWLPVHDFAPSPAACARRAGALLAERPLGFVAGEVALAEGAGGVLDRLAGLARRCLNEGGLALAIGGHTDSRGEAPENAALSERRAMSVLLELVVRGVRADSMRAKGYGEARPVADNDTEAGRARNRRISFEWSE